jgi:DNA-binding response OmpR family regulator
MPNESSQRPLRFLCVDDDPAFLAYLLLLAEPYNLSLDTCGNMAAARQKLSSQTYDGYIIDLNLPDGSGFELIVEIRIKEGNKHPIAVVSGVYRDEKTYRILKEKYSIDYVLDKPIYPEQFNNLLAELCQPKTAPPLAATPAQTLAVKFEILKSKYDQTICDKIDLLTKLIKAAQETPDQQSIPALKDAVHKIAGSAGSYGYVDVSTLCKELEFHINQKLSSKDAIEKGWLSSLDDFLRKIKYSFQFPSTQKQDQSYILPTSMSRPSLYVVDSDVKFLELLQREKEEFAIDLFVESNAEKALTRLKSAEFNPRIIVISQTFFGSNINAFDLIDIVHQKQSPFSTIFAILLENDNVDIRIDAIQKGIKYIFHKPMSAHVLLKAMTDALEIGSLHNFKILILDDDLDVCNFVSFALSEIGFEVKAIQDPLYLYQTLEEYAPKLLFLDISLPSYDGFSLLKTLRADIAYQNLIIVMVTIHQEADTQLRAYSGHADEILYKPLNKAILQECVLNLAKRTALSGLSPGQNRLGLNEFKTLLKRLHEILTAPQFFQYLILFRIDHYSDLVLQHGQSIVNDFLVSISNLLQSMEDNTISCFSYDASTFAILFSGYDETIIERKIFDLLTLIQSQSLLNISFSCSIVPVSKDLGNNHDIIQIAEIALNDALKKEPTPIKIVTHLPQGVPIHKKTLVLTKLSSFFLLIQKALKTIFKT